MVEKLKEHIEVKFGRKISYQKDCKDLSNRILLATSKVISPSTLRRFFGFLATNSNPSRVTLDILSTYCNFKDWDDFNAKNRTTPNQEPVLEVWEKAKNIAKNISTKSCANIKAQNHLSSHKTITRYFAEERLENFLKSPFVASSFVGPGGFGKTSLLVDWFEKNTSTTKFKNHIILFLSASHLEAWSAKDISLAMWLLSILEIEKSNIFDNLNQNPQLQPGKFIVIIDAIDEISLNPSKTEKIYTGIHLLTTSFSPNWFKLIVSSRYSTWNQFISLTKSMDKWYLSSQEVFTKDGTNMPSLNEAEIQSIIDKTINQTSTTRLVVEELPYDLLGTVSYPYYLQLFLEIYNPENKHLVTDRTDLLMEFIKKQILKSSVADEKIDILNAIIDLSHKDNSFGAVKKNDLKERYPIHLKLAGDYYNAYNQLVSYGIISEELKDNSFGTLSKMVKISQQTLYCLLTILTLIEKRGNISFDLFIHIEKKYSNSPIQAPLINLLYEITYKRKIIEPLKSFFSLKDETLEKVFEYSNIHQAIRNDDFMRRELIPLYSRNSKARKLFFQRFIDINTIATSSRLLIFNYLQHSETKNEIFLGRTMQIISNTYGLDLRWIENFSYEFNITHPYENSPPIISGLWFSCCLIDNYLNLRNNFKDIYKNLDTFISNKVKAWTDYDRNVFELGLVFGFLITKQYEIIYSRTSNLLETKVQGYLTQEENALLVCQKFARWHLKNCFEEAEAQEIQKSLNDLPSWISYQTTIIGKAWLAMYYFTNGHIEKAYENFRKAVELSNIAGYTIFEIKLLNSLMNVLVSIGENERALECNALIQSLSGGSKVEFESL